MYSVALPDRTVMNQQGLPDLARLAQQGILTPETLVWREGWSTWMPAGQVPELVSVVRRSPAPVAEPPTPPCRTPVQSSAAAPTAGSTGQRKPGVLIYLVALVLSVVAVGVGYRAWTMCGPTAEESELPQAKPSERSVRPAGKLESRVALDNQRLLLEATRFRSLASGKLDDALKAYDTPACLRFLRSSEVGREAPQVWAYFFSCSLLLIGHAQDTDPIIAFYHPFLDAALMTRWCWRGGRATISDATLWIGSCFPDGGAVVPAYPHWMGVARQTPFHNALLAGHRDFVSRFDRAFPVRPVDALKFPQVANQVEVQAFVEQHAAAQLLTLVKLRSHRGLANLRKAFAEGRASALEALIPPGSSFTSGTLLQLPSGLRERMVPSFALASAQHTIVTLSVPELPRFYILAQFGTAEAPLQHLSVQELN